MNDFPIIVTLDDRYYDKQGKLVIGKEIDEGMHKATRPYLEGTLISDSDNTYFIPFRTNLNQKFAKSHPTAVLSLATPKNPQAGLDISKTIVVGNDMEFHVHQSGIDSDQFQILKNKRKVLMERLEKYVGEYKREVRSGEKLRPEYRYTSLRNFHKELGLEKMENQTERQLDLENLKNLQEEGKIEKGEDLDKIAAQLPAWRESEDSQDKLELAKYGRDSDLDKLVSDKDKWVRAIVAKRGREEDLDQLVSDKSDYVRAAVALNGRDKDLDKLRIDDSEKVRSSVAAAGRDEDLDILVHDMSEYVRATVAEQGRDKDLDRLAHDLDFTVRETVADVGRSRDLDKLVDDPNPEVREHVADQGRDKDLDILVSDKDATVRMIVAGQGRDKDLDKLASDKDWEVRLAVVEAGRDKDLLKLMNDRNSEVRHSAEYVYKYGTERSDNEEENTPELLEKRREAARLGMEDKLR